jgi:nitrogen fixation protein FixH
MKTKKQYKDSAQMAGYAMLGGILTFIGLLIYNMIVYGVS